jgi:hypothetical protein
VVDAGPGRGECSVEDTSVSALGCLRAARCGSWRIKTADFWFHPRFSVS